MLPDANRMLEPAGPVKGWQVERLLRDPCPALFFPPPP